MGGRLTDGSLTAGAKATSDVLTSSSSRFNAAPPASVVPGSIGVLGGTFDPIHHGHLAIAENVRETLGLERVLFIPAAVPPHKPGGAVASAADRATMVELAVAGNPAFAVDRIELERDGRSFSVDTLATLVERDASAGRRAAYTFILSGEALAGFRTWHAPDRLLDLARLAVVPRRGGEGVDRAWFEATFPGRGDRVTFVVGPLLDVSGTEIRALIGAGRSVRYLVPDAVSRYIADHDLYRPSPRRMPAT